MESKTNFFLMILLVVLSFNCKAQQPNLAIKIVGTWISNNDSTYKLIFTSDGLQKSYYDNILSSTFSYTITTKCKDQILTTDYDIFLKVIDIDDNETYCHLLNGIHTENNGVKTLSITTERGKLYLFTKQ